MPPLRRMLALAGAMGTRAARGCPKDMATTLPAPGADSVLALQDNQPPLHGAGPLGVAASTAERWDGIPAARHTTVDADHGRLATRHYGIPSASEG